MNRRHFLNLSATGLAVAVLPVTIPLTGCTYTKADLIADAQDIDTAVVSILSALGQTALASTIQNDLAQFDTAVNNWNSSTPANTIISLAGDLEIALGDTGLPLVIVGPADAIIGAVELLIQQLTKSAPPAAAPAVMNVSTHIRPKPPVPSSKREAYKGWNEAIKGTPIAVRTIKVGWF